MERVRRANPTDQIFSLDPARTPGLVIIVGVGRVAVLRLLAHERPHLVELDLAGPRGKEPPARRERRGRVARTVSPGGRPSRDGRRGGARSGGRRSPRRGGGGRSGPSPRAGGCGTGACPCARSRSERGRPWCVIAPSAGARWAEVLGKRCVRHYYA